VLTLRIGPPAIGLVSQAFDSSRAGLTVVALLGVATALLAGHARWGEGAPHAGTTPVAQATAEL
jgi:hypothetical protein